MIVGVAVIAGMPREQDHDRRRHRHDGALLRRD
jgi:hypothetical protein